MTARQFARWQARTSEARYRYIAEGGARPATELTRLEPFTRCLCADCCRQRPGRAREKSRTLAGIRRDTATYIPRAGLLP